MHLNMKQRTNMVCSGSLEPFYIVSYYIVSYYTVGQEFNTSSYINLNGLGERFSRFRRSIRPPLINFSVWWIFFIKPYFFSFHIKGNRLQFRNRAEVVTFFSIPLAATADFMVLRIGQIATLLLLMDHFGPFRTS